LSLMAKRKVFTIGLDLPGDDFEAIEFDSDRTLLDADITIFFPTLGEYSTYERHEGKIILDEHASFEKPLRLKHWHSEIVSAVNAGKLVIIYLVKPIECFRYTGQRQYSGTGRNSRTTNIVAPISSYNSVPMLDSVIPKTGTAIRLETRASFLGPYWAEFSQCSPYVVEITGKFTRSLLTSRDGNRIVGAMARTKSLGTLMFLPPLQLEDKRFTRFNAKTDEPYWTSEARRLGKRLLIAIAGIAETLSQNSRGTPIPPWVGNSIYRLEQEGLLNSEIVDCTKKISEIQSRKAALETQLRKAGSLRNLLFEQGEALEKAIVEALRLFAFEAESYVDGESEFDSVFSSPEGRCLGEAEGKDTKAINIEKFSQLERNIHEDFARDEVSQQAKGVLFGNAFRLASLEERGDFFTEKCKAAAKRIGAALVRTPDLFLPARYLKEHPGDVTFAQKCRAAILGAVGNVVEFPVPPEQQTTPTDTQSR
jgi:hypothetical protein